MGSTFRRLKLQLMFKWADTRTRSSFLLLTAAAIMFYIVVPRLFHPTHKKYENSGAELEEIFDAMPDTQPMDCRDHAYDFHRLDSAHTVSIITEFSDDSFYDFQLTLMSVIEHTPYDLYTEIVVLQDGPTDATTSREIATFFSNPRLNKVKVFKSDKREGVMSTRFKLTAVAKGDLLVYVHPTAVVNRGWLQPLLARVIEDPELIAVPHSDSMQDGNVFESIDRQLIDVFTWSLATVSIESPEVQDTDDDLLDSPVMRGDVFAVQRSFVERIGGFDDKFLQTDGVPSHVELSLRAWRYGGAIRIVKCSRVFVRDALKERRVAETSDLRHMVELWFDDMQSLAYRQARVDGGLTEAERDAIDLRRQYHKNLRTTKCEGFAWYLQNVLGKAVAVPSKHAKYFGKLRSAAGYCTRTLSGSSTTKKLTIAECAEDDLAYKKVMVFEMNRKGAISQDEWCLEPNLDDGLVELQQCQSDNPRQQWWVTNSMLIPATLPRMCLAVNPGDAVLELRNCNHDSDYQQWTFTAS